MVALTGGELEDGRDVVGFQIRVVCEDLGAIGAGGEQLQNILDANTKPANGRTPAAHLGVNGNSVEL
jgi:hypothetical protein